jgi:hypothetical protein
MAQSTSVPSFASARSGVGPVGLNRPLRRWLADELAALRSAITVSAAACDAEHSRKHFDSFQHACLLLFHGLSSHPSVHQSYEHFAACDGLVAVSGLAAGAEARFGVSYSQVMASNGTRPAAFLAGLVPRLTARVQQAPWSDPRPGAQAASAALLAALVIQDSTFVRLSLRLATWLPPLRRPDGSGVRLQLWYRPAQDLPEVVRLTTVRTNDCQALDQAVLSDPARLAALVGQTFVVDLGYYSHERFARLLGAGVHLVTRRHPQATVTIEAEQPIQPPLPSCDGGRITVLADHRITLGSSNNRAGAVLAGLRLVTAEVLPRAKPGHRTPTPRRYEVLTDRWDLDAAEVVQVYLWRWQIELFLRWLKGQLHLPRLLGYSENAVALTVWLAIVVHLLTVLAARALGLAQRSPLLLGRLAIALQQLDPTHRHTTAHDVRQLPLPFLDGLDLVPT